MPERYIDRAIDVRLWPDEGQCVYLGCEELAAERTKLLARDVPVPDAKALTLCNAHEQLVLSALQAENLGAVSLRVLWKGPGVVGAVYLDAIRQADNEPIDAMFK